MTSIVFLTMFYPLVPTLTFLSILWIKDENAIPRSHKHLAHWAMMATVIEGCIEAPIQFIFQVKSKPKIFHSGQFTNYQGHR